MKTPRLFALLLVALLTLLHPRPAAARVEASFDFFYDSLAPYGEWVEVADYGYCWRPTDVDPDWAPYTDGYWAYTDAGWTWVSYEDFGGIVYHYGRWLRVEDEGWCWVPEYEWGPAWVSWRNNDDYVGWAPLPPEARWQPEVGISVWADRDYDIGPGYYSFCHVRDFGAPVLRPVIINRFENVTIIRRTVNVTNISYNTHYGNGPVIFNGGPGFAFINERSSRRIPALKLVQNTKIDMSGMRDGNRGDRRRNFNGQAIGNQLVVSAPFVRPPSDAGFLKGKVTKTFSADKVKRGWSGVKNDDVRRDLKQEMQRQTKGLTRDSAPARVVAENDLKVLPEKADPKATSPVADRERERGEGRDRDRSEGQGRGPQTRDPQKPVAGDAPLKPFNPKADTDPNSRHDRNPGVVPPDATRDPRVARPGDDTPRTRDGEAGRDPRTAKPGDDGMRARDAEAAAAAAKQKALADQDAAKKQADQQAAELQRRQAMEQQQRQQRDRTPGDDQGRRGRDGQRPPMQGDPSQQLQQQQQAAEQQRRQIIEQQQRGQRDAAEQARRAQEAQRPPQLPQIPPQPPQQIQRRPQGDPQAAEQQRRQIMEQQQRGQRDAAEQARRAQQQQQQQQPQTQPPQPQRQPQQRQRPPQGQPQPPAQPQAQPQGAPPTATPADGDQNRRRQRN